MPVKPPRICRCGATVMGGARCECEAQAETKRKATYDKARPSSSARGYTSAWEKARKAYLAKHPFCAHAGCRALATVVDHIRPHRGDQGLFWDSTNWQSLCAPHHNGAKQRQERKL